MELKAYSAEIPICESEVETETQTKCQETTTGVTISSESTTSSTRKEETTTATTKEVTTKEVTTETTTEATKEATTKTTSTTKKAVEKEVEQKATTQAVYSPGYFKVQGVIYWGDWRWTYYSQNVLPGPGLKIPGRHVDSNGYVCDCDDNICLASSKLSKGTVVSTPFGKNGKIYDSGCAYNTLDVYVNW